VKPEDVSCPVCAAPPGSLTIEMALQVPQLGTWSLAGAQLKTPARWAPHLSCSSCLAESWGSMDSDGHHATFPALVPKEPPS
jgi:hypothetical protein